MTTGLFCDFCNCEVEVLFQIFTQEHGNVLLCEDCKKRVSESQEEKESLRDELWEPGDELNERQTSLKKYYKKMNELEFDEATEKIKDKKFLESLGFSKEEVKKIKNGKEKREKKDKK